MLEARAMDLNERIERGEHIDGLVMAIFGHSMRKSIDLDQEPNLIRPTPTSCDLQDVDRATSLAMN